jgi:Leucine-rich repeat (LRR) protein
MTGVSGSSPRYEHQNSSFWIESSVQSTQEQNNKKSLSNIPSIESSDQSAQEQNNKKNLWNIPSDDPLQLVFTTVGLDPLTSRTCTTFYNVHKKMYGKILYGYVQDPTMAPFVDKLSLESIKGMDPSLQNAKIGEIYSKVVKSAKELGIPPFNGKLANPHLELSEIQRLAKEIQRARDIDFLIFFTIAFKFKFSSKKNGNCLNDPSSLRKELEALPQHKLTKKAASFREWLCDHPNALNGITNLDFFGHGLTSIPPEIAHFTYLNTVNFSHNEIRHIPPEFNRLERLFWADLSFNKIRTLSVRLPCLHTLLASNNRIQVLGPEFAPSPQLRLLSLARNQLTCIPRIFANLPLDTLSLSSNQLREIYVLHPHLNKMHSFNCEDNPLCFHSEFLVTLLDLLAIDGPESKDSTYKKARLLLKRAQKGPHHLRLQDQFKILVRKLPNSPLKEKLEEVQLIVTRNILSKMALSSHPHEIPLFFKELPLSLRQRLTSWRKLLEKKWGGKGTTPNCNEESLRLATRLCFLYTSLQLYKKYKDPNVLDNLRETSKHFVKSLKESIHKKPPSAETSEEKNSLENNPPAPDDDADDESYVQSIQSLFDNFLLPS